MVMVLSKLNSNDKDSIDRFWLAVESFLISVGNKIYTVPVKYRESSGRIPFKISDS
jgi:hypothetical protein